MSVVHTTEDVDDYVLQHHNFFLTKLDAWFVYQLKLS